MVEAGGTYVWRGDFHTSGIFFKDLLICDIGFKEQGLYYSVRADRSEAMSVD